MCTLDSLPVYSATDQQTHFLDINQAMLIQAVVITLFQDMLPVLVIPALVEILSMVARAVSLIQVIIILLLVCMLHIQIPPDTIILL